MTIDELFESESGSESDRVLSALTITIALGVALTLALAAPVICSKMTVFYHMNLRDLGAIGCTQRSLLALEVDALGTAVVLLV